MERVSEIKYAHSVITLLEDHFIEYLPIAEWKGVINTHEAQEVFNAFDKLAPLDDRYVLAYLPDYEVSNEAQMFTSSKDDIACAVALVSKSMIQTLLGNLLINIRKMRTTARMFTDEKKALAWLRDKRESRVNLKETA